MDSMQVFFIIVYDLPGRHFMTCLIRDEMLRMDFMQSRELATICAICFPEHCCVPHPMAQMGHNRKHAHSVKAIWKELDMLQFHQ